MALSTAGSLKQYIGYSGSDQDTRLAAILVQAQAAIEGWCRRVFEQTTYTDFVLDGPGENALILPQYPCSAFSDLRYDPDRAFGSDKVVDPTTYVLDGPSGIVRRISNSRWPHGPRLLRATFTAGYASIPAELTLACNIVAADLWTRSRALEGGGWQNEMINDAVAGQGPTSYRQEHDVRSGLPVRATAILANFRKL